MELHDRGDWAKFNLDTCAAQTTIPKSWKAIHRTPGSTVTFKTASGELIPMEGTGSYVGSNEKWTSDAKSRDQCQCGQTLVSAYKCLSRGRLAVLYVLMNIEAMFCL